LSHASGNCIKNSLDSLKNARYDVTCVMRPDTRIE
jgi:hypothetical protein